MADEPLQNAILLEVVKHISGNSSIALIELASGEHRYVSLEEWGRRTSHKTEHEKPPGLAHRTAPSAAASPTESSTAVPSPAIFPSATPSATAKSTTAEKLALYRSLFKGRDDVYALGYRKPDGGIAYAPVCANKFKSGLCAIAKGRRKPCATCKNLTYAPLTDEALVAHFIGKSPEYKDVVGIYPLREDETTWVLVADFDGEGWQDAARAYREAAAAHGIIPAIERSRSGNGAHAWIFFQTPISAALARQMGTALLEQALDLSKAITFSAFDRLFPAQATMPKGGLGNLIALPLQGRAYRNGNSVFVDENVQPYADQWHYLSIIEKVPEETARRVASASKASFAQGAQHTDTIAAAASAEGQLLPSDRRGAAGTPLGRRDFPQELAIQKRAMLCIPQHGLSTRARARLLKLASFGNPAFYRAQAMHLSVHGKPQVICLAEERGETIYLPRGCEEGLVSLLDTASIPYRIIDQRPHHPAIAVTFTGTLRSEQQTAAEALLAHDLGVLSAPTGFGKTVIGAYLIAATHMRTLVIVPSVSLLNQWRARLEEFLDIQESPCQTLTKTGRKSRRQASPIGQIGGGKHCPSGIIDIATLQSLVVEGDVADTKVVTGSIADYDLVIVDECHHGAAPTLEMVLRALTAQRVYGLSATPKRDDGLERIVFMHCGPIRYAVSAKEQAGAQHFKRLLTPRFTRMSYPALNAGASFNDVLTALQGHPKRNALIVQDVIDAVRNGRHALVLTKRKNHVELLAKALSSHVNPVFTLTGSGTAAQKRELLQEIRDIPDSVPFAVVATGSYVGEGFDEPRLDALFVALPISCEAVVTQYSGRLHRETPGKRDVVIYDYIDSTVPMLDRMYQRRLRTYTKLGYQVAANDSPDGADGTCPALLDKKTYGRRFADDISEAARSITLAAPYGNEKRIHMLLPFLKDAVERGVQVEIWLPAPASAARRDHHTRMVAALDHAGCTVNADKRIAAPFALFDQSLLWYGSLPLLAFPKEDDCSLRLYDAELALEFLARLQGNAS